jgi:PIN domain nuclease of toxin-antitoxin system
MGDARLSSKARQSIEDATNVKFVSAASIWEIAIKVSLGILTLAKSFDLFIPTQLRHNGFTVLPIEVAHCAAISTLPFHHRDPFDRLLIAQSLTEGIPVVGMDTAFDAYAVQRIW